MIVRVSRVGATDGYFVEYDSHCRRRGGIGNLRLLRAEIYEIKKERQDRDGPIAR